MRILIFFFLLFSFQAFSQGPVDRIELGYQTTKRGIEWTRPGLPTHVPAWRVSRDTNAIIWHDKNTGIRYDWDYFTSVWYARGRFSSALPPLPTQTSGLATIDNRTAFYLNASNILHRYDITQTAWVPLKMTYQSAAPTNVAAGVSNGAAVYTTTLWQDSDDFLIRYWDGDSWELIGGGTVTSVGLALPTSVFDISGSPVTSSGTLTATFDNQSANTVFAGPTSGGAATPAFRALVAADLPAGTASLWTDGGAFTYLTSTTDNAVIGASTQASSGRLEVSKTYSNTSDANVVLVGNIPALNWRSTKRFTAIAGYLDPSKLTVLGTTTSNADPTTQLASFVNTGDFEIYNNAVVSGRVNATSAASSFGLSAAAANVDFHVGIASSRSARFDFLSSAGKLEFFTPASGSNRNFSFASSNYSTGDFSLLRSTTAGGSPTTNVWTVDPTGLFGIGTGTPSKTLEVAGELRVTDLTNGTGTSVVGSTAGGDVTNLALSGMSISSGTLTATDGSTTNELQTIANTSDATSHTGTLSNSGGSLQFVEGTGITLTTTGTGLNGILTIASTGITSATGYINGGNSFGGAATIGLNDNFDWAFETNGTTRGWIDNAGTYTIGSSILTTAALNISGLQNNIGMHVAGGTGLTGPVMLQTRGTGSGSDCTVLDAQHFFTSGNVVALIQNTSTTGTGGVEIAANAKTATGDPRLHLEIDGTTDWSIGIDNDDVDNLKLHRFAVPSDNNGVGTLEFGYDGTSLGLALNKVGIGTSANSHYAIDALGKFRADQFVNNSAGTVTTGTYALGTAAGTSPSLSGSSEFWGNGGRLIFTSGTSPTTNGVICTVTLGAEYTFAECAPIMQGRSTNAGAFNYSCSYNSATRVITCTLVGTLTAATVYEFNILFLGRN